MPFFALLAAGVVLHGDGALLTDPVVVGVVLGLVVGKPLGVLGGAWAVTRVTRAELDGELSWRDVAGVAVLAGVGFTVALLVADLSFGPAEAEAAKTAVLAGSVWPACWRPRCWAAAAGRTARRGAPDRNADRARSAGLVPVRSGHEGGTMTQASNAPVTRPHPDVPSKEDPTLGRLVADASRDISTLFRQEIALAKSELKISVKAGGIGIGLFAGAAFLGVLAVIMLSVAIAYFVHMTGLDLAWCFLIVFLLYVLIAALLAFIGVRKVKQVKRSGAGHLPGAGDEEHPQAWLRSRSRRPSTRRDPGPLAAPTRRRQRGTVPRRGGGPATGPWCCSCTASPSSGGPGGTSCPALAAAGYRAVAMDLRGYGGSDKTPDGYDPVTLAQTSPASSSRSGPAAPSSSGTAGAGTSDGRPPCCTPARSRRCARSRRRTRRDAGSCGPAASRRCGTCWRCRCPGARSAGSPTRDGVPA